MRLNVSSLRQAVKRDLPIAFVPQQPVVPTGMSVVEYVGLGRTPHRGVMRIGRDDDQQIVREVLSRVGIESFARRDVGSLSGGERQRVVLARALAQHTLVLVLDEPTTGLDPQTRVHLWDYINMLAKTVGVAVFLTTHYMEEADRLADRIAIIDQLCLGMERVTERWIHASLEAKGIAQSSYAEGEEWIVLGLMCIGRAGR